MRIGIRSILTSGRICKTVLLGLVTIAMIIPGGGVVLSQSSTGSSSFALITFDDPSAASGLTYAYGVNGTGQIVGEFWDAGYHEHGFLRDAGGTFTTIDVPNATLTRAFGINDNGQIVGGFGDAGGGHGFFRDAGGTFTTINAPGAHGTIATGINGTGQVAGWFTDANNKRHGFLRDVGGTFTTFDVPNSIETDAYGINGTGQIVGYFFSTYNTTGAYCGYGPTPAGCVHGFVRGAGGAFTTIDDPNLLFTQAFGINDAGQIVGDFEDASGTVHGFLRSAGGTFTTIDGPNAIQTVAFGINNNNISQIVGYFTTVGVTSQVAHGFLANRKPDPRLTVPQWFQAGIPAPPGCPGPACPAWWTPPYPGNFWAPDPYDDHSLAEAQQQGFTIGNYGCALTTLTTEANFWGNHLNDPMGFDTTFGLDPRQMNHWKGMYCTSKTCRGDVDWNNWAMFQHTNLVRVYRQCTPNAAATDKSCGKNTFPILPNNTAVPVNGLYTLDTATQTLDSILRNGDRGVPVILPIVDSSGVSVSNEKHWVVITGKASHVQTASGSFIDTYLVNDPGDVQVEALDRFITTDSQGHVITHFGVADAGYATGDGITAASVRKSLLRIDQWKVYSIQPLVKMDPNTPQALGIYTSDPVEFVLTDPQGRRTGFDPGTNTSFEEIPTSSYSHAVHRNERDFSIPDPPPFKSLDMANQIDGQYTLNVIGTGSRDFTIEVRSSDAAGNWITQTYSGTTAPGVSSQFTFQGAVTTFVAFSANVAISPSHQAFGVDGSFTLGTGGTISPLTQPVTIQIGDTFLATIPAGSFEQTPQGTFVFGGVIQGVLLAAALTPTGGNGYAFAVAGAGAPDLPSTNPVDLRLAIGSNGGSTSVNATFVP